MKNYLRYLKQLDGNNILLVLDDEVEGVPEEVFRLLRAEFGIAFVISKGTTYSWRVGEVTRKKLAELETFTGKYSVGRDGIGYYWKQL